MPMKPSITHLRSTVNPDTRVLPPNDVVIVWTKCGRQVWIGLVGTEAISCNECNRIAAGEDVATVECEWCGAGPTDEMGPVEVRHDGAAHQACRTAGREAAGPHFAFTFQVTDGEVRYTPWTDGHAVGFRVEHRDLQGEAEYVYLNPSTETDGEPNVFLYQGIEGDPCRDAPEHYYSLLLGPGCILPPVPAPDPAVVLAAEGLYQATTGAGIHDGSHRNETAWQESWATAVRLVREHRTSTQGGA